MIGKLFILPTVSGTMEREELQKVLVHSSDEIVPLLKVMAHPSRLGILILLLDGPLTFGALLGAIDLRKSALANHLIELQEKSLIKKVHHGLYAITEDGKSYLQAIAGVYSESKSRKDKIEEMRQREESTKAFLERK
jgi:DNA-binding HxlR family transcriptional regulator